MTTKRRKLLALTVLAVIGGVIAYSLLRRDYEPTYQGRRKGVPHNHIFFSRRIAHLAN